MQTNKSDLRTVKTTKVLNAAMHSLLERNDFRKITVRDICAEAQVSRATFYARFADKYDFLKNWLATIQPTTVKKNDAFEDISITLNGFVYQYRKPIEHVLSGADSETMDILADFMLSVFRIIDEQDIKKMSHFQTVLSNFFAGGMIYYFQWQVKNKFASDIIPINKHLYALMRKLQELEDISATKGDDVYH